MTKLLVRQLTLTQQQIYWCLVIILMRTARFKAEGVDLIINDIRLASVSYGQLNSNNFSFANGSIFVRGTTANNTINSSLYGDYIDISQGGSDTASTNEVLISLLLEQH